MKKADNLESLLKVIKSYKEAGNKILSTKYKANYSLTNPMLKVK